MPDSPIPEGQIYISPSQWRATFTTETVVIHITRTMVHTYTCTILWQEKSKKVRAAVTIVPCYPSPSRSATVRVPQGDRHALALERRIESILSTQKQQASNRGGDHCGSLSARIISPESSPEYRGSPFGILPSRSRLPMTPVRQRRHVECGATTHLNHQQRQEHLEPGQKRFGKMSPGGKAGLWITLAESITPKKTNASLYTSEPVPMRTTRD